MKKIRYKRFLKAIPRKTLIYFQSSILLQDGFFTKWWVLDTFFITICVVQLCNDVMSCSSSLLLPGWEDQTWVSQCNGETEKWLTVCHSCSSVISSLGGVSLLFNWHMGHENGVFLCVPPHPAGLYQFCLGHVPLFTLCEVGIICHNIIVEEPLLEGSRHWCDQIHTLLAANPVRLFVATYG